MGRLLVPGEAEGDVLALDEPLSFWGGVDAATGRLVDRQHPQRGASLAGKVLVLPGTRGSCTGSGVLLDLALEGRAPAAIVLRGPEEVATLGALVAAEMFGVRVPVLRLGPEDHARAASARRLAVAEGRLRGTDWSVALDAVAEGAVALTEDERAMLEGAGGPAIATAMRLLVAMAAAQGAPALIPVSRAHIDGCIYAAPAFLRFAEAMRDMGARVRVPTTTNAISVDRARWRAQGVAPSFGEPAARLADAYVAMGAAPSFTCAPYLLEGPPAFGEVLAWGESNAVLYANSVLGARTAKLPDFLDLCAAVTGRAPRAGVYDDAARRPARVIEVDWPARADGAAWPLLGWLAGRAAPDRVPLIRGLEGARPSGDDLKAFCAAFGTTSGAPMLHLAGVTPEADGPLAPGADTVRLTGADLREGWRRLTDAPARVDLVALGAPHLSLAELRAFAGLMADGRCTVDCLVTLGRDVLAQAQAEGLAEALGQAGVRLVPDLCWCSITEPVLPPSARAVLMNSGKYAHYGPGLHGRSVRLGGLADCAEAARTGRAPEGPPAWLVGG
jgi:predicted aconitase/predicted aconitase with swiveling domain